MHKKVVFLLFLIISIYGCSSGNPRTDIDQNSYGIVTESNLVGPVYSTESLQQFILGSSGICNGLRIGQSGEDGVIASLLCQSNQIALSQNPDLSRVLSGTSIESFVVANPLGINSVASYRMVYTTGGTPHVYAGGATDGTHNVSAAILVPQINGQPLPESSIKGVVLYFHATIVAKGGVPSDFYGDITGIPVPSDMSIAQNQDMILAATFASHGFIVIAPDYIGQGVDWTYQHPYVIFPDVMAQTGFNAIKAAKVALAAESVSLPNPLNLYISSYSEGGAYALWASKLAQTSYAQFLANNNINLVKTVGISGAYDLSGAMLNFVFTNLSNSWESATNTWNVSPGIQESGIFAKYFPAINFQANLNIALGKPGLAGYLLAAFASYDTSQAALYVLAPQFAAMNTCANFETYITESNTPISSIPSTSCSLPYNLSALFNTRGLSQAQIGGQVLGSVIGTSNYLTGGLSLNQLIAQTLSTNTGFNSIGYFVSSGIVTDPDLLLYASAADIATGFKTNSPISLIYLDYDSVLTNVNSQEACGLRGDFVNPSQSLKNLSESMVRCINIPNGTNDANPTNSLYTQDALSGAPIFIDHSQALPITQLFSLNEILLSESTVE